MTISHFYKLIKPSLIMKLVNGMFIEFIHKDIWIFYVVSLFQFVNKRDVSFSLQSVTRDKSKGFWAILRMKVTTNIKKQINTPQKHW